jgi:hypothetical protein
MPNWSIRVIDKEGKIINITYYEPKSEAKKDMERLERVYKRYSTVSHLEIKQTNVQ